MSALVVLVRAILTSILLIAHRLSSFLIANQRIHCPFVDYELKAKLVPVLLVAAAIGPMHCNSGMSQEQRDRVMRLFRAGTACLLIATDVAARGLDVEQLSHVINFHVPAVANLTAHPFFLHHGVFISSCSATRKMRQLLCAHAPSCRDLLEPACQVPPRWSPLNQR